MEHIKQQQLSKSEQTNQVKWELLTNEICKFAMTYSKNVS